MIEHPNVVKLIEVLATNSKIYIVLELVSGGDLFDKIRMQKYVQTESRPGLMCGKRLLTEYFCAGGCSGYVYGLSEN